MSAGKLLAARNADAEKSKIWATSDSSSQMLNLLDELEVRIAPRKMRLFAIAICQLIRSFAQDADCRQAIEYSEALMAGTMSAPSADEDEIKAFGQSLEKRRLRIINRTERSVVDEWAISAAINLLQTDREYFLGLGTAALREVASRAMSAGVRTGREIKSLEDVKPSDLDNAATIIVGQAAILHEIIGNPFTLTEIDSTWLTDDVVRLATAHDRTPSVATMTQLNEALFKAGCRDENILSHCQADHVHPHGCWLIDLLLGLPTFEQSPFAWDYELSLSETGEASHDSLVDIKSKLRELSSTEDGRLKQVTRQTGQDLADWLERRGFKNWSAFIRCAAEIDEPGNSESYASAVANYDMHYAGCGYRIAIPRVYLKDRELWPRWWSESHTNMRFGLPSAIGPKPFGGGRLHTTALVDSMSDAMTHLPIRDINLEGDYADVLPQILASVAAGAITTFRCKAESSTVGATPLQALNDSGLARTLERLVLKNWLEDKAVHELANTPLDSLETLDFFEVCGIRCDSDEFKQLATQAWFKNLRSLRMNFRGSCCAVVMPTLSRMSQLRTLAIADSREDIFSHSAQQITFSALQRLYLGIDELNSEIAKLCEYLAPNLIEFWLSSKRTIGKNLIALLKSELLSSISVLRLDTRKFNNQAMDALLTSPIARNLRVLELLAMTTSGLSKKGVKAFADATTLPNLISLKLVGLFDKADYPICSQWLRSIDCPSLRHLTLEDCKLDDNCLIAILENPGFKQLESLRISEGYGACHVTPEGAERFLRALDIPNLRLLHFHKTQIGNRIECLLDPACIPSVELASFSDTLTSPEVIEKIKHLRPTFVINR